MTFDRHDHWQTVYTVKEPTSVSWYAPHLDVSLQLLEFAGMNPTSRIIDVGAGASSLAADLLARGLTRITALDVSTAALDIARDALGERAPDIHWLAVDVLQARLEPDAYDFWHDRAVLHFLTDARDAAAYVETAANSLAIGGCAIIGGFAADGPERCSGLPVVRRDAEALAKLFGPRFELTRQQRQLHRTPTGAAQAFAYAVLRKL